jgi:hypothetical protein
MENNQQKSNDLPIIAMDKKQVVNIINYIDSSQDESVKKDIFTALGNECFAQGHGKDWGLIYNGNMHDFVDQVNKQGKATFWEKLVWDDENSTLLLTGKEVSRCSCSFGQSENPAKSLCNYCCKAFQKNYWSSLFNKNVEIEITEAFILGGTRCNTKIHIL